MKLVGGRLCLDFVNTVEAWTSSCMSPTGQSSEMGSMTQSQIFADTPTQEKLVDYASLVRWGEFASVITDWQAHELLRCAAKRTTAATSIWRRALRLRLALYRLCKSFVEGREAAAVELDVLHHELALARRHERLVQDGGRLSWAWEESSGALDRVLWPVARSAAEFLTMDDLSRLRQCQGRECGWMFLDTSRNRSRLWCDMSDCGNLAKVRRWRRRSADS